MNVVFRVDSSLQMGIGHVMRCITLADALRSKGSTCLFICRNFPGHIGDVVLANGHQLVLLDAPDAPLPVQLAGPSARSTYRGWLGVSWQVDADDVAVVLSGMQADWLVVDHYGLDADWERRLRSHYDRLLVIDDLADRPHASDLLLDSNAFADADTRYSAFVSGGAKCLFGPRYALLRPEFSSARPAALAFKQRKRLFVGFGGADAGNQTLASVRAAHRLCAAGVGCDVVVGASYPYVDTLQAEIAARGYLDVRLHINTQDIAVLMGRARLAICGGGGSTWERLCMGLPSLVSANAENQFQALSYLQNLSMIRFLGRADEVTPEALAEAVGTLWADDEALYVLHVKGGAFVDGRGVERVAEQIGC